MFVHFINAAGTNTFNAMLGDKQNKNRVTRHEIASVFWLW